MVKIVKPLTDTEIKSAKPKEDDHTLSDGNGLYILIRKSGSKVWRFNYINPITNKRALVSFGSYPTVTLQQARQRREEYRSLVSQKIDPQSHFNKIQQLANSENEYTFKRVAEKWYQQQESRDITKGTLQRIINSLDNYIFPTLGNKPITQLKAKDFIEVLTPLENAGKIDTVKRISQRINRIMAYAINNDIIKINPTVNISKAFKSHKKQNLPSLPPSES